MTAGVGNIVAKAPTVLGKIGQAAMHGASQGVMANAANISGSEQNLSGLATDVLGGAIIGGGLRSVNLGAKGFLNNLNYNKYINPIRNEVSKESISPAFGYANSLETFVRNDLPPRVKKFVQSHEDYHVYDFNKNPNASNSFIRRELPANFYPAIKDPIGFLSTVKESLTPDRLSFYKNRLSKNK